MTQRQILPRENSSEIRTKTTELINRKSQSVAVNLPNYIIRLYNQTAEANPENASIIYDFICAQKTEINIKDSTKSDKIRKLCWLSKSLNHKSFHEMTKQDIVQYLDSLKKPPSDDPRGKSIGTYNGRQMVFLKFFKWLYDPDEPDQKKRATPSCMKGVKALPRREKTYIPEDIWQSEDQVVIWLWVRKHHFVKRSQGTYCCRNIVILYDNTVIRLFEYCLPVPKTAWPLFSQGCAKVGEMLRVNSVPNINSEAIISVEGLTNRIFKLYYISNASQE